MQHGFKGMEELARTTTQLCGENPGPSSGASEKQWLLQFLQSRRAQFVPKPEYIPEVFNARIDASEKRVNELNRVHFPLARYEWHPPSRRPPAMTLLVTNFRGILQD